MQKNYFLKILIQAKKKHTKYELLHESSNNFEQIAREWIQNKIKTWSATHYKKVIQNLEINIFPYIGNKNINTIEPLEMLSLFQKIEERGAFEITRKTRKRCGEVFKYAIITGRCKYNPCSDLSGALQRHQSEHYPYLLEKDMPLFLSTLTEYKHTSNIINMAAKLLIITVVRTGELRGAEWAEFDLDSGLWEIPAQRMKKRKSQYAQDKTYFDQLWYWLNNHGAAYLLDYLLNYDLSDFDPRRAVQTNALKNQILSNLTGIDGFIYDQLASDNPFNYLANYGRIKVSELVSLYIAWAKENGEVITQPRARRELGHFFTDVLQVNKTGRAGRGDGVIYELPDINTMIQRFAGIRLKMNGYELF